MPTGTSGNSAAWVRCHINTELLKQQSDLRQELAGIFPDGDLLVEAADVERYSFDKSPAGHAQAFAVVFPRKSLQLVQLVRFARERKFGLVPSGGRTGLSGAANACGGEIIVSFEKMNRVLEFDSAQNTVCVEPGVTTEAVQNLAAEKNLYYPIDLAAKGSSQIGGNIATNAGGIHVLGHGMTRSQVLALEVVTGEGELLQLGEALEKDNTGYDLKQLFIGSEGTLGFITKATLQLLKPPSGVETFFLAADSIQSALQLFNLLAEKFTARAFEFFCEASMTAVCDFMDLSRPTSASARYYFIVEFESVTPQQSENLLELLEQGIDQGLVNEVIKAESLSQQKQLWQFRESASDATSVEKPCKFDVTIRPGKMQLFLDELETKLTKSEVVKTFFHFGHLADGNVHLNIVPANDEVVKQLETTVYQQVIDYKGSISAEHGIGLLKKPWLAQARGEQQVTIMRKIKTLFDPSGIMNPGKIID